MTFDEWLDEQIAVTGEIARIHSAMGGEKLNTPDLLKLVRAYRKGTPFYFHPETRDEIAALEAALMGEKCST